VRVLEVDERMAKAAIFGLKPRQRATREMEKPGLCKALVRDDGLTQVEAAHLWGSTRVGCAAGWRCWRS